MLISWHFENNHPSKIFKPYKLFIFFFSESVAYYIVRATFYLIITWGCCEVGQSSYFVQAKAIKSDSEQM